MSVRTVPATDGLIGRPHRTERVALSMGEC